MAENRGKQFETIIKKSFESVSNTAVIRLHDQTSGFKGSTNLCDFIVYRYPRLYLIECKSIHGNTFPLANITDNQWRMAEFEELNGVYAGIICWFVDKDVTGFFPIHQLKELKESGRKSVRYDEIYYPIPGVKKRIFFDYDMKEFFNMF